MIVGERLVVWAVVTAIVILALVLFFRDAHGYG
jgi:hypothetical protein